MKKVFILLMLFLSIVFVPSTFAKDSFVSIVNPIRGNDFWDLGDQKPETAVLGQIEILSKASLPATWLIRFDALADKNIINAVKSRSLDEKGLFLEITPSWADEAKVEYHKADSWHVAGSAFLTGYEAKEREKFIDAAFEKFKNVFGFYPVSVGAWWIDSYSLGYMQKKYGINAVLIVADQYSTDNYQIWGQYFGTPYYPAKNNALHPAGVLDVKLPVVMMQWAARDPVNAYGNGVSESTYSVQANDYIDFHNLNTDYFSSLVDIYTKQQFNQFSHIVIGLENSYSWNQYSGEYQKQMQTLVDKKNNNQIKIVSMKDFAFWYKGFFPEISPEHLIVADDPLGSFKKAVWFMNPYYRAALFINQEGVVFRDIRQYVEGEEELCFTKSCSSVNFATFPTRVLDDVTYGSKWILDEGRIKDFNIIKKSDSYVVSYINEAGNKRTVEFLPRDIKVDDKISTIDGAILNVIKQDKETIQKNNGFKNGSFSWSVTTIFSKLISFLLFLIIACLLPGLVLTNKLLERITSSGQRIFLSIVTGFVLLTLIFYVTSLLNLRYLSFVYIFVAILLFIKLKLWVNLKLSVKGIDRLTVVASMVIIGGTIFQTLPTFRSGLVFPYGLGFWGPNTHDGIWHISLINQAVAGLPLENPIFAGTNLKNYHFFYDLLVAATAILTKIPVLDLVFRFYPVLFSLLLGMGTYYLVLGLFIGRVGILRAKVAVIFSLYFVYFAGSFGWIVEYLKQKTLGGESAFWANQSISFNLNPPFAISLLIIIAFLHIFLLLKKGVNFWVIALSVLLIGSLIGFKVYGVVLIILALIPLSLIYAFKKEFSLLFIIIFSSLFAFIIFLSNFQTGQQLVQFAPFWFIHSLVDSSSRVGWDRLSIARVAGLQTHNWFKFVSAETVGLFLFITGNLGMRVLSFIPILKYKEVLRNNKLLFILIISVFSFAIPIIFVQAGNPWNTIQFTYYGLYLAAVISGVILSSLIFGLPKLLAIIILSGVLVLAPINSITTATYYLGLPHAIVSEEELKALNFLSKQPNGVVLTYPYDEKTKQKFSEPRPLFAYDSTAYVSALSKKSVFLEDEPQNQILLTAYKKRLVFSKDFFLNPALQKKFLQDNKISYIYLPKIYNLTLDDNLGLARIFENQEVNIYGVK